MSKILNHILNKKLLSPLLIGCGLLLAACGSGAAPSASASVAPSSVAASPSSPAASASSAAASPSSAGASAPASSAAASPSASSSASASAGGAAGGLTKLKVAHVPSTLFAPLYIAIDKGYMKQQGIEADLTVVTAGQDAMAFLANGQLDAAVAGIAAATYNA
ncbi:MAG: ABC transporter substrate-binding protein, partial [Chloroflexota bacterium]